MADPRIVRLEPLRPRGLRLRVHLDRGDPLEEVALEALERLGLGVGDALPAKHRHLLLDADAEVKVREAALNLLSYRARTRTELKRKLKIKCASSSVVVLTPDAATQQTNQFPGNGQAEPGASVVPGG